MARRRSRCRRSSPRLSICIVFVPMFFLTGVARYLFVPLAEAVVFAMLASYFLSRTLIPTLVMYIMRGHEHKAAGPKTIFGRFQRGFENGFEKFRNGYYQLLETTLEHSKVFAACFIAFCALSMVLVFFLGEDFFPECRCRPDASSRARACRNASGRDGALLRRDREPICGSRSPKTS